MIKSLYITNLGLLDNLARTQILPYLRGLSGKGVRVWMLTFEKAGNLYDRARVNELENALRRMNITWIRRLYHTRWGNLLDICAGIAAAWKIVNDENITVIHARASVPILIAWPVAKITRRKIVYDRRGTMAGDFVDDANVKNMFSMKGFSALLNVVDRFMIRHADATIVLSRRALHLLESSPPAGAKKTVREFIPCCADIDRFDNYSYCPVPGLRNRFVLCYLGSLGTCYLLREMADFYKVLRKSVPKSVFHIISHTDRSFIERELDGRGLNPDEDYIINDVEPAEVPGYLSAASVSIMFIKPVDCKIGSSPTKFGESLSMGVPVIINKGIGDTGDIIESGRIGVVVDEFRENNYKAAVDKMTALMEEGKGLKERCRAVARKHFSLEDGVNKYLNVYKKITE